MTATSGDLPSFGSLLKTFRTRKHLTQQQLAVIVGMHRHAIGRWELGDFLPASKAIVLEVAKHLHLDDQETRQLLEASLTAPSPLWLVPFPRNPFFTGREETLTTLYTKLGVDQTVALTQSSALHGLGGVGKTQIALEYAYRYALEYRAVFWIGAETVEQVVSDLLRVAEVLQLPGRDDKSQQHVLEAVQRWLMTQSRWLLIWDNVEDLALLQHFLPSTRQGAMLITTRCQALGTLARGIDLLPMEHEEGTLFLLRRAKVLEPEATCEQMQQLAAGLSPQYMAAAQLVIEMGGLPLALDQAGGYLEETRCGLPAYLDLFRTRSNSLLQQRGEKVPTHPESVSTTFTLAITASTQSHPAVWDLLRLCALLQSDAIPEELFRQGSKHLGTRLEAIGCDELEWNRLIAVVCAYSLLARQPEEQTLSLHRLVQVVLLSVMTEAERRQWNGCAIEALDALFPQVRHATEYTIWQQCERLLPHALLCLNRSGVAEESVILASLTFKVAQYLRERGRYAEAEPLYQRALRIWEQPPEPDHSDVARGCNGLAILYYCQGKYAEAEPLYQRALHISEQALGPEHLDVARSVNNLANLYLGQGRYAEGESLCRRALHISERALGPDHLDVARPVNNLAALYQMQERYVEAEPLYLRALHTWEQALGANHPLVAYGLNNLAGLYMKQEKYPEAEPLLLRSRCISEQALGPDHPGAVYSLNNLANLFREQGRYEEAEPLYQQVLSIREQQLEPQHPEIGETLFELAVFRQKQGKRSEAKHFMKRALEIFSQSLGDTHPQTVAARTLYAQLIQVHTRAEKEATAKQSVKGSDRKRSLSPLPERTTSSSENDPLQEFLHVCCELHPRAWSKASDLWQAYGWWVKQHQERFPLSRSAFIVQLKAHGCRSARTNAARIWYGIALVNTES